jgi:hypothetical protein
MTTAEWRFLHGFIEGRPQGFIAGRAEGYAQLLVHVLTVRFDPLPEGCPIWCTTRHTRLTSTSSRLGWPAP